MAIAVTDAVVPITPEPGQNRPQSVHADSTLHRLELHGAHPDELAFYQSYDWSLNHYPTVAEAVFFLQAEIKKLPIVANDWRVGEVATNLFLLGCGLFNCVEEYLRGPTLHLPGRLAATLPGRAATRVFEAISARPFSRGQVARWRDQWLAGLTEFLSVLVSENKTPERLCETAQKLAIVLQTPLPSDLQAERIGSATTFGRLDLTEHDLLELGKMFVRRFPDRAQPILMLGLRTSGSYLAPFLKAFLEVQGYRDVGLLTIEPNKGVSRREMRNLVAFAAGRYMAVIVDDPPYTSRTILAALDLTNAAGFPHSNVKFLVPTHAAKRDWFGVLPDASVITIAPEQWHKAKLLDQKLVETRLAEYFIDRGFARVTVDPRNAAKVFNSHLESIASDLRGARLKRVYEVELETTRGKKETKYVLAKSVGWGWLSYRGFIIAQRLAGYVPPVLGLRDGILYMEWIPHQVSPNTKRTEFVSRCASYVATRARNLKIIGDHGSLGLKRYNNGVRLLERTLSRAYGPVLAGSLMRARLKEILDQRKCPCPALIDGNMRQDEWTFGPRGLLKVDFEHHGLGKAALNVTDPAYDLADTILNLELSREEEHDLITKYVKESGDCTVEQRLFMHKLLAGLWAMNEVQEHLFSSPRGSDVQQAYHRRFMQAWHFLTVQTAYHCGASCASTSAPTWNSPIIALDIDGVIDRRLFGYPCTSAAGMEALALLSTNGLSVALNSARSTAEIKEYCKAYSLAGGIAENGSYIWDAVHQRGKTLVSLETAQQLSLLRKHLSTIPGVFLDERHQYSVRAFTYKEKPLGLINSLIGSVRASPIGDGGIGPISTHVVHQLLVDLNLDRLTFRHSPLDTAIFAKETDKGAGLIALRDWVLSEKTETIAIGDSDADLPMFRVATRGFAPANIGCKRQAKLLGCHIAAHRDQRGLLDIVHKILQSERPSRAHNDAISPRCADNLFFSILCAADGGGPAHLLRAMAHSKAYKFFVRS